MKGNLRFLSIELENFKNIRHGKVSFPQITTDKESGHNIIGVYGQNGSGKTALVQAFEVIRLLIRQKELDKNLIFEGEDYARITLEFEFFGENPCHAFYEIELAINEKQELKLQKEVFTYRPSVKHKKSQKIIYRASANEATDMLRIVTKKGDEIPFDFKNENEIVEVKLAQRLGTSLLLSLATLKGNSFLVRADAMGHKILKAIVEKIGINTTIISSKDNHNFYADQFLPVTVSALEFQGDGPFILCDFIAALPYAAEPSLLDIAWFQTNRRILESINIILPQLVPGLTIELEEVGEETMFDGSKGIRFKCLSVRDGRKIPLYYESTGIKKMVSILGVLIALFNQEEVFVIIDELDAGIFEFLLGELLQVLNHYALGQLLFTSHNLRLLEVLEKENLVFTTTNPDNRFIKMKGLRATNNIRDSYIRAVQIGGQDEELYAETDDFYIKQAFKKAGMIKHEK